MVDLANFAFRVLGGLLVLVSQQRRPSKGDIYDREDAPACRRRHYACNSSEGYR
jgi:hypothetical protein